MGFDRDDKTKVENPLPIELETAAAERTVTHTNGTVGTTAASIVLTNISAFRFHMADSAGAGAEIYIKGTLVNAPNSTNSFVVRKGRPYEIFANPGETLTVTYEYAAASANTPFIYEVWE